MKNLILKFACLIALISCDKDDDKPKTELEKLPPATQIGAQTIGCLVNGKAFIDNSSFNNFYQFIDGEYYLVINWFRNTSQEYKSGQIAINRIQIEEGQTYILNKSSYTDGDYTGGGATFVSTLPEIYGQYETNTNYTGQIHFTRFDTQNFIMSGTFEFEAKDILTEETIIITNGRFDMQYTN